MHTRVMLIDHFRYCGEGRAFAILLVGGVDMKNEKYGTKWSHDETVIALGLYFQIPFGKINQTTPEVVRIARLMGREPASLSMKMGNIGRLDPTLARRGVTGLVNGAKMEEQVWNEYAGRRDELATRYHELILGLSRAGGGVEALDDDVSIKTPQGLDGVRLAHYRINQSFFRRSVLSAYDNKCCITGLTGDRLLIASHIKPWAQCANGNERTDTANGLCLNSLHDRAFDKGLITLDEELRVVLSASLKDATPREVFADYFIRYEGKRIALPERGRPSAAFLSYHRNNVFQG